LERLLLSENRLELTISRLCQEILEQQEEQLADTVLIGLQPKGVFFASRLQARLAQFSGKKFPFGKLDVTFYRDDFRRRESPLKANSTEIDFIIENKNVLLIDDVLYTGRSVSAALSAMTAFGRPRKVDLLVLIDRKYSRDLPIEPRYVGLSVNTIQSQRIKTQWSELGFAQDEIWLVANEF
jgi:pyrimidine operon attenuation protein/uracil phosphoribosyltransferase